MENNFDQSLGTIQGTRLTTDGVGLWCYLISTVMLLSPKYGHTMANGKELKSNSKGSGNFLSSYPSIFGSKKYTRICMMGDTDW